MGCPSELTQAATMLQSSLKPGLLFQRCSSAYVTRLPVIWRTVSSAERQYVPRTSTSTPSTSKIRISVGESFFAAVTETLEQKERSVATRAEKCALALTGSRVAEGCWICVRLQLLWRGALGQQDWLRFRSAAGGYCEGGCPTAS